MCGTGNELQQKAMFGVTADRLEAEWRDERLSDPAFYITCILSDVQEAIRIGDTEKARQWLNKAKYFLIEKVRPALEGDDA